jgi:ABC-type proline/glycine betaine transport system permease subunit
VDSKKGIGGGSIMIDLISYMSSHADHLLELAFEQLIMALLAVLMGVVIAIPIGVWISSAQRWVKPVLWWSMLCRRYRCSH